jgi:hypothetical protein
MQVEASRQTELMNQLVLATGDVVKLEGVLNQNLSALAGSKNFENTVMSLAAAIHLLNTRLQPAETNRVELKQSRGRAA